MTPDSFYITSFFGIPVLAFITAGAGAYLGSYLKKKGENLATHEDFETVLTELKETTRVTKEIEGKIDDQVWNRQRQWEMKRDILVEAIRAMGEMRNAQYGVIAAFRAAKVATPEDQQKIWMAKKTEAIETWRLATEKLESGRILAAVLGNATLNDALRNFNISVRRAYTSITHDEPEAQFNESMELMNRYDAESLAAARAALGIEQT